MTSQWLELGDLPWQRDYPLTMDMAAAMIRGRFPSVSTTGLRHLGYGWEFDAFLTDDGWVFRFPRRGEWSYRFDVERQVIAVVQPALPGGVAVPRIELHAEPTEGFPYPFAGHRFIDGVAADRIADHLLPTYARDIAALLGALHSIPASRGRAIGLREVNDTHATGARTFRSQVVADAQRLRGMDSVVDAALDTVAREDDPPEYFRVPLQIIHADLRPEHVIVDPRTGRLSGVLDWTDAMLGDAARDFVFLATCWGWPLVEEVLTHYPRKVDSGFRERLGWMARLLSLFWLDHAFVTNRDVDQQLRGIRNVFAPGSPRSGLIAAR